MECTLYGFSITIWLAIHFANSENVDRPTRYITDGEFANLENVKSADQNSDASLFGESEPFAAQDRGNYFMYQHVPKPDHYEFAYKRGNEHHFRQHHEKAAPHEGHFKIQARWGDKHGGYGEHYWDYNHGGDAHEEGSSNEEVIDPSQTQTAKTVASSPTSIDSRDTPQSSENHKFEQKKHKKYIKSQKPKHEEFRAVKKPEVTEAPQNEQQPELYHDIPKLKIKPAYEREYSSNIDSRKSHQNSNLYTDTTDFPIVYDLPPKRHNTASHYDQARLIKSYSYDPQADQGYAM